MQESAEIGARAAAGGACRWLPRRVATRFRPERMAQRLALRLGGGSWDGLTGLESSATALAICPPRHCHHSTLSRTELKPRPRIRLLIRDSQHAINVHPPPSPRPDPFPNPS